MTTCSWLALGTSEDVYPELVTQRMLPLACARALAPLRRFTTAQSITSAPGLRVTERDCGLSVRPARSLSPCSGANGLGCSGFQNEFSVERIHPERQSEADSSGDPPDPIFDDHGATVKLDPISLPFVKGAAVDHIDELVSPQGACGCGTSFAANNS